MAEVLYLLFCSVCVKLTKHNVRFSEDEIAILTCSKCGAIHTDLPIPENGRRT